MFIGESLSNLRIFYGYSRKQLSEMIGVSEQAVWQYENGFSSPKYEVIQSLTEIFGVKSKYFYKNDSLYGKPRVVNANHIAYRSTERGSTLKAQSHAQHVEFLDKLINLVGSYVILPPTKLKGLRDYSIKMLSNDSDQPRLVAIKKIAEYARSHLNLPQDSNEGLLMAIEKAGVFVFEKSIEQHTDAYSLWTDNDVPYIILGNMKKSAARRNFDLAHELGHLLLHYKVDFMEHDASSHEVCEREANIFAGNFLLPEREFANDFNFISRKSNPDSLINLKKKWHVSIQAIAMRAKELSLITPEQSSYFWRVMSQKKYRQVEPLDDIIPIATPVKFKSILQVLDRNSLLTIEDLLSNFYASDSKFLHALTGIESEFFKVNLQSKTTAAVSDIQSLRKIKTM